MVVRRCCGTRARVVPVLWAVPPIQELAYREAFGHYGPSVARAGGEADRSRACRSEFLLEHGFLDRITPRNELKQTIAGILRIFGDGLGSIPGDALEARTPFKTETDPGSNSDLNPDPDSGSG